MSERWPGLLAVAHYCRSPLTPCCFLQMAGFPTVAAYIAWLKQGYGILATNDARALPPADMSIARAMLDALDAVGSKWTAQAEGIVQQLGAADSNYMSLDEPAPPATGPTQVRLDHV